MNPAALTFVDVLRVEAEEAGWRFRLGRGNPLMYVAERGEHTCFGETEQELLRLVLERSKQTQKGHRR